MSRFWLKSTVNWPDWYVYMENAAGANVRGYKGNPGDQGHWIFTQVGDKYLISPKKWPKWYIYMEDNGTGNVKGWSGDPGPQGHWKLNKIGTVTIGDRNFNKYLLNTEKWPNWYMYMENNSTGNVRGWNGDPGPQGHFIYEEEI